MQGLHRCRSCLAPKPYLFLAADEHAALAERGLSASLDLHACLACGLIQVPQEPPVEPGAGERGMEILACGSCEGGWALRVGGSAPPDPEALHALRAERGPARRIAIGGPIEHVERLHDFTAAIADMLHDDGILTVEVRWSCTCLGDGAPDSLLEDRISLFSLHSLAALARFWGLAAIDAEPVAEGRSLRVHFRRERERRPPEPVGALLARELRNGIFHAETYDALADRIMMQRERRLLASAEPSFVG